MASSARFPGPPDGRDVRALPPPPLARPHPRVRPLQRGGAVLPYLVAALLLVTFLQGLQTVSKFAVASPIFFEEDFRGCGDGVSITTLGWTHDAVGVGTFACDNSEHFPEVEFNGTESFQHRTITGVIDTWTSPTFSIGGASTFSLGFAVRFESFGTSSFQGAFQFVFRDGGVAAGGFGIPGSGSADVGDIHTLNVNSIWDPTFFQLVLDTWYLIQFDINRGTDSYALSVNGTLIDANGPLGGTTQSMRPAAAAHDIDEVTVSGRSSSQAWIDWVFTDQLTLDPIPDAGVFVSTNVSIAAVPDASTDVIFGLSVAPSFLSVNAQTGLISGTPTAGGVFPVTVTGNVSTGQDSESFVLTVVERGLASFGYSGITASDPCGATYFSSLTGRVRPVPCSDVLLSLDMETLDASGELHDFALDETGTLNHTATRNGLSPIEATFGAGQSFNGSGPQNMTLNGVVSELGRPQSWTAHWWLLLNDDSDNRTLWTKWADVDGAGGWYFEVTGGNQVLVSWGGTDNHTFAQVVPRTIEFPMTITFDFFTGTLSFYMNRTFRESTTFLAHGASEAAPVVPIIGEAQNASSNFNGTLDEFILWQRRALTLDQVVGLHTPFPAPVPLGSLPPPEEDLSTIGILLPGIVTVAAIIGTLSLVIFVFWRLSSTALIRMKELAASRRKK